MQKNEHYLKWIKDRLNKKPSYDFPNSESNNYEKINKSLNLDSLDTWIEENLSNENKLRMQASYRQYVRSLSKQDTKLHLKTEAADKLKALADKHKLSVSEYILNKL